MNPSPDRALDSARRRYGRLNTWFWIFIALIPLGVVVPCLLSIVAYKIWGDQVSAPVGLSALLWPIVGVAGALLVRGARVRARRTLALARLAQPLGLQFTERPANEKFSFLRTISFMENPHTQKGENLFEGQTGQLPWIALDYEYSYSWGSVSEVGSQTIVAFLSGFEHLPAFAIVPISTMGKIENLFLGKRDQIVCGSDPQFHRKFSVVGTDSAPVQRCLGQPLINLFLTDSLLTAVVEQGKLLIFRRLTYIPADGYQAFLATAHRVAELVAGGRHAPS
jgi:hypothetical protein